jgi:hypothetical protein
LEDRYLPSNVTVGPNVNLSRTIGNQLQPTMAIDPVNPSNLAAFSNDQNASGGGIFESFSNDGGTTWTRQHVGTGFDGLPVASGDAQAVYDTFENLFLVYTDNGGNIDIVMSTDGGHTFSLAGAVLDGFAFRPSIAVGPGGSTATGSVWVSFTDTFLRKIEVAGAPVTGPGMVGAFPSSGQLITDSLNGADGDIAVGPNGEVVVTYQQALSTTTGPDEIFTNTDPTGLASVTFQARVKATNTNVGGSRTIPAQSSAGINASAHLAYDLSGGVHEQRLYLVYTDAPDLLHPNDTTIFVRFSDDDGTTWSAAVSVGDDTGVNSQFLPSIAVDQSSGAVGVAWYDARNDQGQGPPPAPPGDTDGIPNDDVQEWASFSFDGGQHFQPNVQVSQGTSNAADSEQNQFGPRQDFGAFVQDKGAFVNSVFYPVWGDNSDSTGDNPDGSLLRLDIYTAPITVVVPLSPPKLRSLQVSPSTPVEGDTITLTGRILTNDNVDPTTLNIDWGDGEPVQQISVTAGVKSFSVPHTYLEESAPGGAPFTITVTASNPNGTSAPGTTTIAVADAPLSQTSPNPNELPPSITLQEGLAGSLALASFADADPNATATDYTITIAIANGPTLAGTARPNDQGGFDILATTNLEEGVYQAAITVADVGGATLTVNEVIHVVNPGISAVGADAGGGPQVTVFDASTGALKFSFFAYDPNFMGGVHVAVANVDGDGSPDIITAPGPGMSSDIRVFDGATGQMIIEFMAYTPAFLGGVYISAADFNHDGFADIVTGAGPGGGPHVQVFDGKSLTQGAVQNLFSFFAFDPNFHGGVRVAAGDVNGDGTPDIVTSAGPGGGPNVRVFSGTTGAKIQDYFAYDPTFTGGVFVAVGDTNGDGFADVVTGAGLGGGPHVEVFSGKDTSLLDSFLAYDASFTGGVRVGVLDGAPGHHGDILMEGGPGPAQQFEIFDPTLQQMLSQEFVFDPNFTGGAFVGGV